MLNQGCNGSLLLRVRTQASQLLCKLPASHCFSSRKCYASTLNVRQGTLQTGLQLQTECTTQTSDNHCSLTGKARLPQQPSVSYTSTLRLHNAPRGQRRAVQCREPSDSPHQISLVKADISAGREDDRGDILESSRTSRQTQAEQHERNKSETNRHNPACSLEPNN